MIVDTTVVKTAIKKSFARTQIATQAKKKKASKARGYRGTLKFYGIA